MSVTKYEGGVVKDCHGHARLEGVTDAWSKFGKIVEAFGCLLNINTGDMEEAPKARILFYADIEVSMGVSKALKAVEEEDEGSEGETDGLPVPRGEREEGGEGMESSEEESGEEDDGGGEG